MAKAISNSNGVRAKPMVAAISSGTTRNAMTSHRLPQPSATPAHHRCQVSSFAARDGLWRVRTAAPTTAISSQSRGDEVWAR